MKHLRLILTVLFLPFLLSTASGQFHPYRLRLGPGNEDLERQIEVIPWTRYNVHVRMKDVSAIDFSGRDLRLAEINLEGNGLYRANFDDCRLDGSSLIETYFLNCSFRNANLRFSEMDSFSINPSSYGDFTGADITGSSLRGLPAASLEQTKNFQEKRLSSIHMLTNLSGRSLRGFDLYNVYFFFPVDGCDFTDARMQRVMISDRFSKDQLYSTATYKSKDLSTLLFQGGFARPGPPAERGNFVGWDFSGCDLGYFLRCDLTSATFVDSFFLNQKGTAVRGYPVERGFPVWLYYRMLKVAEIGFDNCLLSERQFRQTANWKRRDLRGMHLRNMALDGWDFSAQNMQGADLRGSSLKGTNFRGADIERMNLDKCRDLTVAQLLQSATYSSYGRQSIVRRHSNVDFVDLTDEEKEFQRSVRRKFAAFDSD